MTLRMIAGISRQAKATRPSTTAASARQPQKVARMVTIALDPGHGGEDPGAIGANGSREKDIVLEVAKRLKTKLEQLPNTRVMLTRDGDFFVPLNTRVQKARKVQADLFVSIHADAWVSPTASGSSVFVCLPSTQRMPIGSPATTSRPPPRRSARSTSASTS